VLYAQSVGELSARVLLGTQVGLLWSAKIGLLAMVGPTMLWHRTRLWARAGLVIGVGALISGVQSSHSAALKDPLALVFDGLHLLAVAIWVGGLLSLGLLAWKSREGVPWGVVLPRFSQWALLSVLVIVGSGVYLSFKHVGSLAALWSTDYGRFLLVKIALLIVILAMAALNFRQVRRGGEYGQLQRRVWGEFFALVLVLGAAGALTLSPPAHRPTAAQTVLVHETEGIRVTLTISSLRMGSARFTVQLRDAQGQPLSDVQRVTLEFIYAEGQELGMLSTVAPENSTGDFEAVGSYLSLAGRWQIAVRVRLRDRLDDLRALFEVIAQTL
jgi:copper transport protein